MSTKSSVILTKAAQLVADQGTTDHEDQTINLAASHLGLKLTDNGIALAHSSFEALYGWQMFHNNEHSVIALLLTAAKLESEGQ